MKKLELIGILLHNIALEHSAIVQYLYHIFLIQDAEVTEEIEKIARQEMRHMKWFAQKVVQLGGEVELKRIEEEIKVGGPDWVSMLENDVNAEQLAIDTYTKQLELVTDDSVKKLLERVIHDESQHKHEFSELLEEVKRRDFSEEEKKEADQKTLQLLNKLLKEEYRIILEYLYNFFHSKSCEYKDIMLDLAIESMVHMGELGEKLSKMGGVPDLSLPEFGKIKGVEEHIVYEEHSKNEYTKLAEDVSDPSVRKLLEWIEGQEEYHKQRLLDFMRRLRKLTVGDLKKKA
ncbi:bacterioferritin [Hydrogenivirga caldilitoris]|uniref:Bacterioferritin n=1 Tax=Hydrogenivirga caldilitoris TaxID=246264 RepID=A0A497XQX8_9AQUI|nr:ferritin-like domain-containing protein [Hydrogenivirga caldilitoris]RLJ70570.1 bacterioferritin [Hydrogenivirga caldilitoris]